ncbi:sugar phosphate isomerase/epimerase [Paenibacillus pasadenensis]|uniref:sugar phosphate isomerase/epimerase family protein n=1 Tax=Paenibacillus pasadenensis TaxID=217090 RepID=UPI002041A79F|nr:sugar phosphate isomerase/epimerase [Paenibacillus pasadenensis]MCM3749356.1 sugar phosphate isomerase/epimerase [Paenibacillus pasadenensis]
MAKPQVGLQLYTLRDQTEKDFLGTISKVADMGYNYVEFAGYFNTSPEDLNKVLQETGIKAVSAHVGLNFNNPEKMQQDLAEQIEYAKAIGLKYLITPWAPLPENPELSDVESLVATLQKAAKQVKEAGLTYGYHNHDFEFKKVDGKPVIDHLLELIPAEDMIMEFDLGWVHMGGQSPAEYVKRYAGRTPIAHLKDFGDGRRDTEVGSGSVDFDTVFSIAEDAGIEYFIVEQEEFAKSSLESAKLSLDYLRSKGY